MADKVRIGVIGTSAWASMMHMASLKTHPQADLVAVCARNRQRAESIARDRAIPLVYTDYRRMIDEGDLDAVVIVTPGDLHYDMAMDALDAGLHVLCEKPLAHSVEQAREMYMKAKAAGVKHMVFFTYRWLPHYRHVKQLIEDGYIGRCYHGLFRYVYGGGRQPPYGWTSDRKRSNGVLAESGSHIIDLARWYVGDISQVSACLSTFADPVGPDGQRLDAPNDVAALLLQFENGAQGMIQLSSMACVADRGHEQHIILHGASGSLETDYSLQGSDLARGIAKSPVEIRGARADDLHFSTLPIPDRLLGGLQPADSYGVFARQSVGDRLFVDAIVNDRPVAPSFYDGWKVQQVIDAAIEAHQRGCWVSLVS